MEPTTNDIVNALQQHTNATDAAASIGLSYDQLKRRLAAAGLRTSAHYLDGSELSDEDQAILAGGRTDCDWLRSLAGCRKFASPEQIAALDALATHGSVAAAADALGMTAAALRSRLSEIERSSARRGYSPAHDMTHTVPLGFHVDGISQLRDAEGRIKQQWVKSKADKESRIALLMDAVQRIAEPFRGASELVAPPTHNNADLLSVYPMGDPHIGLFAWAQETGDSDFDLRIAETHLVAAVDRLVMLSPPSEQALILNLGDFFHADDQSARTKRGGHALDVDSRWAKVLSVGIRIMRRIIERALEKHDRVRVINEIGNHDDHSSIFLGVCLAQFFENNPRVEIDTSPNPFHYYRFGANLFGVTHGHTVKLAQLPQIMANDRAKDWGDTRHRFWYTGHVHHDQRKELIGCVVETFRTLAARDAWHNAQGYRSGRDMKLHVVHRERGRIMEHRVGVESLPMPGDAS